MTRIIFSLKAHIRFVFKVLYLSDNQISSIDASVFNGLEQLQVIELALNKIKYIYPKLFQGLVNLQVIDLTCNLITSLETKTLRDLLSLKYLKVAGNPILNVDGTILGNLKNTDFNSTDNVYPADKVAEEISKKVAPNINIFLGYQDLQEFEQPGKDF